MHLILISRNFCSFLLIDESKLMKGARGGGGGGSVRWCKWRSSIWQREVEKEGNHRCYEKYTTVILIYNPTQNVLGHFALLPTNGVSVHLPLPTPNTMLTFTQSKPTIPTFPWGGGGLGGFAKPKTHFKIMCHQLPICPKDFWPGMEVYLVWPVNRFTLITTVSKYDKQPIYFFLWVS